MNIPFLIIILMNHLVVPAEQNILNDFVSTINEGAYSAIRSSVFAAREVVGRPITMADVRFFHYNKFNRGLENLLDPANPKGFSQAYGKIFFLIHGWIHSKNFNTYYDGVTNSLISVYPDAHIIQVDWKNGSTQEYSLAAFTTESLGKIIADLIYLIMTRYNIPSDNFICIGHSLGGQACGWVSKFFRKLSKLTLSRIVALDPAGPLFTLRPESKRLNPNDAKVVVVIHTNGGVLGYLTPCGTIDFFPNGGTLQPGCLHIDLRNPLAIAEPLFCDHERVHYYLIEALSTPGSFPASKCSNTDDLKRRSCKGIIVFMGDLENKENGIFYLITKSKSPFSTGRPY